MGRSPMPSRLVTGWTATRLASSHDWPMSYWSTPDGGPSQWQCCNLERAGTGRARYGTSSPRNLEQSCDEIEAAPYLTDPYSSHLPLSNCVHCFASLDRSEEHTSELQSLRHLVCRLL